ncbi:c-type cytochrome [Sphingobacteriaceae bacterium WQ 2009]|uniref:Photosynthetic reaction center cytochrome c subunit n=1 Tax=Rhinopithecimicrobium faecis TaxID=2820698 RepID=A0A8T4HEL7_9SPHI|nr:c-type cytochrome [Sphingobacteriaceae bacterium WQ 2009]
MKINKLTAIASIFFFILTLSAFMPASQEKKEEPAVNLKVLPKNSSNDEVKKVMREFNAALGVKCNHCHVSSTTDPKRMDFASDANPKKEEARKMLKMTAKINKKYFKNAHQGGALKAVSCTTCHNGAATPKV